MDAKPRSTKRLSQAAAILAVPLLLAGYVLSIGPAARWLQSVNLSAWASVYHPLIWLAERSPPVESAIDWYNRK